MKRKFIGIPFFTRLFTVALLAVLVFISSCDKNTGTTANDGNWVRTTPFKGTPRSGAVEFTIGNKAFVGLGFDGDAYVADFFEYDLEQGYWTNKASFPGTLRERAISFSIGDKAYVGLGYNRDLNKVELGDFWEYDSNTDQWTQLADFAGGARYNTVAFAAGGKGYVGTGYDGKNYNNDFWQFDPTTKTWKEIVSYPGNKREEALAFVIDTKAYVCTGRNNGSFDYGFYEYDVTTAKWTNLTPSTDESYYDAFKIAMSRYDATSVVLNGKAYIIAGYVSSPNNTVYQFDPLTKEWAKKTGFEGAARSSGIGFVLNDRAFVGMGQSGSRRFDDIWEFLPEAEYNSND